MRLLGIELRKIDLFRRGQSPPPGGFQPGGRTYDAFFEKDLAQRGTKSQRETQILCFFRYDSPIYAYKGHKRALQAKILQF